MYESLLVVYNLIVLKPKKYTARSRPKSTKKHPRLLLIIIGVLVVAGAIGGYLYIRNKNDRPNTDKTGTTINYRPPTAEEKKQAEDAKDKIVQDQQTQQSGATKDDQPASNRPSKLTVFIARLEQVGPNIEASGYVGGVFEDDGTCTLTLTNGSAKLSKQSKGFKDFNHTTCTPFSFPSSELTKAGAWTVSLSYSSPSGTGTSETKTLEVQ